MLRTAALLATSLLCLPLSSPAQDSPVELKLHWEPAFSKVRRLFKEGRGMAIAAVNFFYTSRR